MMQKYVSSLFLLVSLACRFIPIQPVVYVQAYMASLRHLEWVGPRSILLSPTRRAGVTEKQSAVDTKG